MANIPTQESGRLQNLAADEDPSILEIVTTYLETGETCLALTLDFDGSGLLDGENGVVFSDHMLHALKKQAGFDLPFSCEGDLHVEATFKAAAGVFPSPKY